MREIVVSWGETAEQSGEAGYRLGGIPALEVCALGGERSLAGTEAVVSESLA